METESSNQLLIEAPTSLENTIDRFAPQLDHTKVIFKGKSKLTSQFHKQPTLLNDPSYNILLTLEAIVRPQFESEVLQICDKYIDLFQRACSNIQFNIGESVPQNVIISRMISLLKGSKNRLPKRYKNQITPKEHSPFNRKYRTIKIHKPSLSKVNNLFKARTLKNLKDDMYVQIRQTNAQYTQQQIADETNELNVEPQTCLLQNIQ